MPPRPVIRDRQTSRPLSAVYIGKGSSHHTGSFTSNVSASPSLQDLSQSASAYSSLIDGTPPNDTARLDRRLEKEMGRKSENILALQKVRSLTHRNQLALDKLSRLSPSPASRSANSNSNLPPNSRSPAPSTTSSSRHSSSASNHNRQLRPPPQELARSGSETERESTTHSHSSAYDHSPSISSSYLSTTPPPATPSHHRHHTTSSSSSSSAAYRRVRQTSAPDSPSKARRMVDDASSSNSNVLTRSPSGMRRHRASLASVSQLQLADFSEEEDGLDQDPTRALSDQSGGMRTATNTARDRERTRDRTLSERDMIIQSALAAAATSRRSPLGSRRRAALPKEFRSDLAGGAEDSPSPNMNATANTGSVRRGLGGTVAAARRRDRERDRDSPEDDRRDNWKVSAYIHVLCPDSTHSSLLTFFCLFSAK
ncbi:hypothetical protein CPB84DRAFT_417698 [Gymnopilus junonius]|uniref:Uncharacterized protein n=1 Tax=Gymnopilus junonius TaxID=109634 RepID=A0A9P5N9Y7_GYMJU|nr:hypothetical protein CPB84DRAFT_417698 [Gymnopilus junonius]